MRELYQVVEVGPAWYQENIPCQEACSVKTNCRGYLNLAAASDLSKLGFGVTVYDALDQAGGTTLAGVPPFRLPREVIDRDIAGIVNENVDLRLSTYVGRDVSLRELHDKNDAVLIAAGCFE